jgi:hypothetical protein
MMHFHWNDTTMKILRKIRSVFLNLYTEMLLYDVPFSGYSKNRFRERVKKYKNKTDIYLEYVHFFGDYNREKW